MRRPGFFQVIICCAGISITATAQAQTEARSQNLISQSRLVHLDIISGRITAHRPKYSRGKTISVGEAGSPVREKLETGLSGQRPSLKYERHDSHQHVFVEVDAGTDVMIREETIDERDPTSFHFVQLPNGRGTLTVQANGSTVKYDGASFWHLLLEHPQVCEQTLVPALESLRTEWRLSDTAHNIRAGLLATAKAPLAANQAKLANLIRQLNDPSYVKRRSADRQLREIGQCAYSYLKRIDSSSLTVEQALRVRNVQRSLDCQSGDTADRIVAQLTGDPEIFLVLLDHPNPENRLAAHLHLERIAGTTLEFDAYDSSDHRELQVATLKRRFNLK